MNNNIFEGAKFGDKFLTKDGRIAIYRYHYFDDKETPILDWYVLILKNSDIECYANGKYCNDETVNDFDIVSRYQDSIDEKKLDELANSIEIVNKLPIPYDDCTEECIECFKIGYRSAFNNRTMEE